MHKHRVPPVSYPYINKTESGNILFYILIAVVMFGALSFAISQNNRGNVGALTKEKNNLAATDILDYTNVLASAVVQLRLRGYDNTEISFENDTVSGYTNPNCNGDTGCLVFHPDGGGIVWSEPPAGSNDGSTWLFTGTTVVEQTGSDGTPELAVILPHVTGGVCQEINKKLSIGSGDPPPILNGLASLTDTKFQGTYSTDNTLGTLSSEHAGKSAFCFSETASGQNYFFRTLIAR